MDGQKPMRECPWCNGAGYSVGVTQGCCGNVTDQGECRGSCSIEEQFQEQCQGCYGSGIIPDSVPDLEIRDIRSNPNKVKNNPESISSEAVEFEKWCRDRNHLHHVRGDKIRPIDLAKRPDDGMSVAEYHNPETERLWRLWRDSQEALFASGEVVLRKDVEELVLAAKKFDEAYYQLNQERHVDYSMLDTADFVKIRKALMPFLKIPTGFIEMPEALAKFTTKQEA